MKGLLKDMYIHNTDEIVDKWSIHNIDEIVDKWYIHNIDEIVDKCNNRDQGEIKIKPVNVTLSNYIDFDAENSVKVL